MKIAAWPSLRSRLSGREPLLDLRPYKLGVLGLRDHKGKVFPCRRVEVASDPFCGRLRPRNAPN